ncbi:MAG: DUF4236 domain-containing protein [Deltaproteobacteria bacterium]|nr:DUF4236 domain-containing protein [Deltaproteobacteria bacterium]
MSFRFWRRIKIAPGITLNLSKSGGSLSFGPRGAKFTIGSRGKRATIGLPGTGLFYTSTFPSKKRTKPRKRNSSDYVPTVRPEDRLTLGFFKRLITPDEEELLVHEEMGQHKRARSELEKPCPRQAGLRRGP